jgi:hypothetical protein
MGTKLIFEVPDAQEGGYDARPLGYPIFMEGYTWLVRHERTLLILDGLEHSRAPLDTGSVLLSLPRKNAIQPRFGRLPVALDPHRR